MMIRYSQANGFRFTHELLQQGALYITALYGTRPRQIDINTLRIQALSRAANDPFFGGAKDRPLFHPEYTALPGG